MKSLTGRKGKDVKKSLPSRERGLKSSIGTSFAMIADVAPFAGARIEIFLQNTMCYYELVAPFAGARIEIMINASADQIVLRRSLRGSAD